MELDTMLLALGREIAGTRIKRGLTQAELGEMANVTKRQVGKIERGEAPGQTDQVWRIANALGIDFSKLVQAAEEEARRAG